ncbi:MarR family transcriptional regulator [Sphingomonas sp. A2-49]|uniref:MarR family winged helix-turn-helix transcriptional regulator n=1 Tax=Sphingomonas sp. A2-49 TaxID=1391375 RepID=UPI0021D22ABD|nr:MarR family transcriptional regulator [Sphingomonas sp. A2-49]MCU6455272.1 MarR family transcriptional regulator [Sphingomonas sp. A2-49]
MIDGDELIDADYAALADFRYALRQFLAFSERGAASCGLTPQQHQALLAIRGATHANVSVGYVAERLALKPHSATGLVDRLETLGLVTRRPSPDDGRQALLELTQKAQTLLRQLSKTHREEIVRLRPMLTELLARVD